jgi:hypothetical protein
VAKNFVRRVKSGEIASVSQLKSEFKALAKLSHPDLSGAGGEDFMRLRAEYEAALRGFELYRFGPPRGKAGKAGREDGAAPSLEGAFDALARLMKRGFPKTPRHDKEKERYEQIRRRLLSELDATEPSWGPAFASFEEELIALKGSGSPAFDAALLLLSGILDYRKTRLPALLSANEIALDALGRMGRQGEALAGFPALLMRERPLE